MKIAVYTCITGGYDTVKIPKIIDSRIDYFLFSDDEKIACSPWVYKEIPVTGYNNKDKNRFVKMHPHLIEPLKGYDITVYVDGTVNILGDIYQLISEVAKKNGDIFLYEHHKRNCVYDEAYTCVFLGLDSAFTISRQMLKYRREKFPIHYGLFEANIIFRKKSKELESLMALWWKEYCIGAKRDQLALTYSAWKVKHPIYSLGRSDLRFIHQYFINETHEISYTLKYKNNKKVIFLILKIFSLINRIEKTFKFQFWK